MSITKPQEGHYWGSFASAPDLPNVAGSASQDDRVAEHDLAGVVGGGLYQCIDPTPNAAAWAIIEAGGAVSSLQLVYLNGGDNDFNVAAAKGPIISRAPADTTNNYETRRTFAGGGDAHLIDMGATCTGHGVDIANAGIGNGIKVAQTGDGIGVGVTHTGVGPGIVSAANGVNPTFAADFSTDLTSSAEALRATSLGTGRALHVRVSGPTSVLKVEGAGGVFVTPKSGQNAEITSSGDSSVLITAGNGVSIQAGMDGGGGGAGGDTIVSGGEADAGNNAGGSATLRGGQSRGTGKGGAAIVSTQASLDGGSVSDGGDIELNCAAGTTGGATGDVRVTSARSIQIGTSAGERIPGCVPLTNKSSGALALGDVVVFDKGFSYAVETAAVAANTDVAGVVVIGGAVDSVVQVAVAFVCQCRVDAAGGASPPNIAPGDMLETSAVAGRAQKSAGAVGAVFAKALQPATTDDVLIDVLMWRG